MNGIACIGRHRGIRKPNSLPQHFASITLFSDSVPNKPFTYESVVSNSNK